MAIVTTIYGEMDDSLLERTDGNYEDDNERTSWVEYRLNGEIVHRSVNMHLKHAMVFAEPAIASL